MTGPTAAPPRRRRLAFYAVAAGVFAAAALAAAYLHWMWWVPSRGGVVLIALAAAALMLVGAVAAVIGRRHARVRHVALVVLVMGVGVVAGEALGPSREPDFVTAGTMTLHLESPVVATATGAAYCTNVASATEFMVSNRDMLIEAGDRPVVVIIADVGDRWKALQDSPRKDGVWLRIDVQGRLITDSGKPGTIGMRAADTSTLTSTFSNSGGSIRFAGLVGQPVDQPGGPDFGYNGESLDLAGTLEWTCDAPAVTP